MYRAILSAFGAAMLMAMQLTGSSQALASGGLASFYGYDFAGKPTANGETFNPGAMTAASLSLPFGTVVRVTNRYNGRSVVVRINDRGPYVGGRVIDLSLAAAGAIGMVGSGVAPVDIQIVGSGGGVQVASLSRKHHTSQVQVAARSTTRHHTATVQVASVRTITVASLHHKYGHGKVLLAFAKIKHRHLGTAIASGVSTTAQGHSSELPSN